MIASDLSFGQKQEVKAFSGKAPSPTSFLTEHDKLVDQYVKLLGSRGSLYDDNLREILRSMSHLRTLLAELHTLEQETCQDG